MATSASMSQSIPKLKDYIFTERLGTGTYATVYKAYRKGGNREVVAIKCILKSSLNKISKENLLTEIELLKTLKHENIVRLKDFQWDEEYIYLIMDFCNGGDLSKFIQCRRAVSEVVVKRFLQQLASALKYMRSKNVSHMDLKPHNILLSSPQSPVLKIADFGFAHYLIGDVNASYLRGSPLYMAPEIIIKRFYNERADLWSVGVILYECLFGRAPFASKSVKELETKIIDPKPVELPYGVEISDKCRHLLGGLLQRDPDKRMSFDEFFNHPFVDLEHKPSPDSLKKATEFVTSAVEKDSSGDYKNAISDYCEALDHFMPAIFYEKDTRRKEALRQKVKQYMQRAEELKQMLKPSANLHINESAVTDDPQEQEYLSSAHKRLAEAYTMYQEAQRKETAEEFHEASQLYEKAIELSISVLQEEPKGRRRDLIHSKISVWLGRAEAVKNYLKVRDLQMADTDNQEASISQEGDQDVELKRSFLTDRSVSDTVTCQLLEQTGRPTYIKSQLSHQDQQQCVVINIPCQSS